MGNKMIILMMMSLIVISLLSVNTYASNDDYSSFVEIIMNDGKLLVNFTDEEYEECYEKLGSRKMFGYKVFIENNNVDASYISNTIYSIENDSDSNITYQIDVVLEMNNKTTFKASGSLNGKVSGKKGNDIKADIGAEVGLDYTTVITESRTETQKLDVIVEAHSRCVIYLTGNLSITNGVTRYYYFWMEVYGGGFEIVTLKNQYTRIEKGKI